MSKNRDDIVLRDILNAAQLVAEIKTSEVFKTSEVGWGLCNKSGR